MKTDTKHICLFLLGAEKGAVIQNFKDKKITKASYDSQIKRLIDATNDIIDATILVAFDFDGVIAVFENDKQVSDFWLTNKLDATVGVYKVGKNYQDKEPESDYSLSELHKKYLKGSPP